MEDMMNPASPQDWFEIHNLFIRFTTCLDRGDLDGVASCFTEDGFIPSPVFGDFRGHAMIRDFAERTRRASREGPSQFRHFITTLIAMTDGDRGRATCYLLDYRTSGGKAELLSPGEYDCDLARVEGRWLFTERRITLDLPLPAKL
jgi:hypothetical protein